MNYKDSVYSESTLYAFRKTLFTPILRPVSVMVIQTICYNFFIRQFIFAFLPGKIPVKKVDHPLDEKIPFVPSWVTIYIDFTQFWIRVISFYIRRYGRKVLIPIRDFIASMGRLYVYAAEVYFKILSTTKRPFYIARPRFLMIHLVDPHLFCIPSLHVMVVIHTYTMFSFIARKLGIEEKLKNQVQEMKKGALAISQAIFFVKQHSINCIPAALYAMTNFSSGLFPKEEAENFIKELFSPAPSRGDVPTKCLVHPCASPSTRIAINDQELIKRHILSLYNQFMEERKISKSWEEPIINFLKKMPNASGKK